MIIIIASNLEPYQVEALKMVVKKFIRPIGWTIVDIIRIAPGICYHKIKLEENHVPSM